MALVISNITQAKQAVITVTLTGSQIQSYIPGQLILLTIPPDYGMQQANDLTVQVIASSGLNITVNLDTLLFDPFVVPGGYVTKPASLSPAGSRNIYNNLVVPFHSLANEGN